MDFADLRLHHGVVSENEPSPDALLIEATRAAAVPRMSVRAAAAAADISESRWRQIVKGFQAAGGMQIPVKAPAETAARMAIAVGVTADQMRDAGRDDAADVMALLSGAREREFQGRQLREQQMYDHPDRWPSLAESARALLASAIEARDDVYRAATYLHGSMRMTADALRMLDAATKEGGRQVAGPDEVLRDAVDEGARLTNDAFRALDATTAGALAEANRLVHGQPRSAQDG